MGLEGKPKPLTFVRRNMLIQHQALRRVLVSVGCLAIAACSLRGASQAEIDRIADLLRLEPDQTIADVGAGDGDFTEGLAAKVGTDGHVFATEVKEDLVRKIEDRMRDGNLSQVTAVLGDQDDIGLAAGCCDAILLRLVYHHFEKPDKMRSDLWLALKPGGLLAIIDITPQENWRVLPRVPDRGGHGIPTRDLLAEMRDAGFKFVEEQLDWVGDEDRYAVLFRRPLTKAAKEESSAEGSLAER